MISKYRMGLITMPLTDAGYIPVSNMIRIINATSVITYVITDKDIIKFEIMDNKIFNLIGLRKSKSKLFISDLVNHLFMQIEICRNIVNLRNKVDIWVFFLDSHALILPVIVTKLIKKKMIFALAASLSNSANARGDFTTHLFAFFERFTIRLADRILLYSNNLIYEWNFEEYVNKIVLYQKHMIDLNIFKRTIQLSDRNKLIGYIGRFSEEKGIIAFVEAISTILEIDGEILFLIAGGGHLRNKILELITNYNLSNNVQLIEWIPHDKLPYYLNYIKLIVIPSRSEGLPNIMLEAMACGTPVLATPVGAIPDIIKDGETGFLMDSNSPECIAANVIRALEHPDLEEVAQRARVLVEREFTFEKAVERWRKVLEEVGDDGR